MGRRRNRKPRPALVKQDSPTAFERNDGYVNEYTGIGDYLQDKTLGGKLGGLDFFVRTFSNAEAEARWRGSDLGGRVIEAIPDEMTREGWELAIQPSEDEADGEATKPGKKMPGDKVKPEAGDKEDAFGGPDPMALLGEVKKPPQPFEQPDDEPARMAEAVEAAMEELGLCKAITRALCYERAFGGAAILIGADDGSLDLSQPLNEENITEVRWLNVLAGGRDGECVAWRYYSDPRAAKYGEPEIYQVRNLGMPIGSQMVPGAAPPPEVKPESRLFYVHESRMLVFPGPDTSYRARVQNHGWGDSIFVRLDEVLSQFSQTWGGIANLMAQFHQDVLKMSGAAIGMAGGNKGSKGNPLANRARTIQLTKSIARMLVIDADEEFLRETASLGGVKEVLEQFAMRLAAAADMPVDLLFSSMNGGGLAKGDNTVRFFYDRIAAKQKRTLLPQLKRIYKLVMLSKEGPTEGEEPEMWNLKFNPLYQLSELEQATLRKTVAETDKLYIDAGVLTPEEVAASAYGGSEWSMERTIDFDGREEMAAQHDAEQEERKAQGMKVLEQGMKAQEQAAKAPPAKPPAGK